MADALVIGPQTTVYSVKSNVFTTLWRIPEVKLFLFIADSASLRARMQQTYFEDKPAEHSMKSYLKLTF